MVCRDRLTMLEEEQLLVLYGRLLQSRDYSVLHLHEHYNISGRGGEMDIFGIRHDGAMLYVEHKHKDSLLSRHRAREQGVRAITAFKPYFDEINVCFYSMYSYERLVSFRHGVIW